MKQSSLASYLGTRPSEGIGGAASRSLYYTVQRDGYEMGLEVFDDDTQSVMVTLFHWENEGQKQRLTHFASSEESRRFAKVYASRKGRFFIFEKRRVYLPKR